MLSERNPGLRTMARSKRHAPTEYERRELMEEATQSYRGASARASDATAGLQSPVKKRKVDTSGSARAVGDPVNAPQLAALLDVGLPTPEANSLAEQEQPSKDVFPFLKLPAELRMDIYRCALCRDEPLLLDLPPKDEKDEDAETPKPKKARNNAGVNVKLLRACSLVYKEARQIFYSENCFTLSIESSVATLAQLHQRSRSLIRSVTLAIPSHHDILDSFADMVRLGLRYCWGLRTFTIRLDVMLPDFDTLPAGHHGGIYANAFRILRWLPKGCKVILEGNVNESVKRVVAEEGRLLVELDEISYFRRQHQMSGRVSGSSFMPSQRDVKGPSNQTVEEGRVPDPGNLSAPERAYFTRSCRSMH
ncbi:hypothetical protein P171DRAFT_469595 [Karstenula rhodostoma CBS 690.94]|uniref:2EXR domain-containing protein n=1 Tax=Karstenula rhodostoma CBS 690.94 TaxID=1392251 RepID=A0A9P4UHT1_9PLEO|nr:hypothetical protein P171DRAFT_469595 [Karstenula rhodostoma CBS 690.94]